MATSTPHQTLHLTPVDVWEGQRMVVMYRPEAFVEEGFIHCTDTDERMVMVANLFYQGDPRAFVVLTVDLGQVQARWVYEDPEQVFPHIYGELDVAAP